MERTSPASLEMHGLACELFQARALDVMSSESASLDKHIPLTAGPYGSENQPLVRFVTLGHFDYHISHPAFCAKGCARMPDLCANVSSLESKLFKDWQEQESDSMS